MKLKTTLAAIVTTAVTGVVLLTVAGQAQACIYSQRGITDGASTTPINSPTTTQVDLGNGNLHKLGIAGFGLAGLGGLFAGSLFLKRRLDRKVALLSEEESQALPEQFPEQFLELDVPKFGIEIPQEVIQSLKSADADLTSVR